MAVTLKAHRINRGLSQEEAAALIGVTVPTLISWEQCKTYPDVPKIKKIEEAYNVKYDDIIFLPSN